MVKQVVISTTWKTSSPPLATSLATSLAEAAGGADLAKAVMFAAT
jgi:hypothetical protein